MFNDRNRAVFYGPILYIKNNSYIYQTLSDMPSKELKFYFRQLKRLRAQAPDQAYKIVATLQSEILTYIKDRQLLDKGIDGKGRFLGHYAPYTIFLKKQKGEIYSHTTLLDTGDFYDGMYAIGKYGNIHIYSTDVKTEDLVERYGPDIFTLTVEHNAEINDILILPRLEKWLIDSIVI